MKFLRRMAVLLYVTLIIFLSSCVLLFVLHYIEVRSVLNAFALIYFDDTLRMVFAVGAGVLLFLNFIFYQVFTVNTHKEKTIAFDNPAGRVSVSLFAIEDLTKRVISRIPEVKEVKSKISASKKGLNIKIKLTLRAEGNIPEVTSRVQELVKKKVQDTIGIEGPVEVAIYVGKILPDQDKGKRHPKKEEERREPEPNVPFQGYRP